MMLLWVIFYCLAILVSVLGVALKAKVYVELMRRRRREFSDAADAEPYPTKHTESLGESEKSILMCYANLAAGLLEDLPIGILGLVYLRVQMSLQKTVNLVTLLSIASSYLMLGIKLCKLPLLKGLWDEEGKQTKKLSRVTLDALTDGVVPWLKRIGQLSEYVPHLEEAGLSADEILGIRSEEPLIKLGIQDEVDRMYLLLQLARVRAHARFMAGCGAGANGAAMMEDKPSKLVFLRKLLFRSNPAARSLMDLPNPPPEGNRNLELAGRPAASVEMWPVTP